MGSPCATYLINFTRKSDKRKKWNTEIYLAGRAAAGVYWEGTGGRPDLEALLRL